MQPTKQHAVRLATAALLALSLQLATQVSPAEARPKAPTNLQADGTNPAAVKLTWQQPGSSTAINSYLIRRDGVTIERVEGFVGLPPTSYTDDPGFGTFRYTVIAVDVNRLRSRPSRSVTVTTDGSASQPSPTSDNDEPIQRSDLCKAIIPVDLRGSNRPTALEQWGCSPALGMVPSAYDTESFLGTGIGSEPHPIRDAIQSLFIDLPVKLGQMFYLLISAFFAWALSPATYSGFADLAAGLMNGLKANPNFGALITLFIGVGAFALAARLGRDQHRMVLKLVGLSLVILTALSYILGDPGRFTRMAVEKPIGLVGAIVSEAQEVADGTLVEKNYNLSARPTFHGDTLKNQIRRSENTDWLLAQYVQMCAINFNDLNFAVNKFMPDSRITWCEGHMRVANTKDGDDNDDYEEKLKEADEEVYDFYQGQDQLQRVAFTVVAKTQEITHNLVKVVHILTFFGVEVLLVFELFFVLLWLITALGLFKHLRNTAARRFFTAAHWLSMMLAAAFLLVLCRLLEAYIFSQASTSGFLVMEAEAIIANLVSLYMTFKLYSQLKKANEERMEQLGAEDHHDRSWLASGAKMLAAGVGAGTAAEVVQRRFDRDDEEGRRSSEQEVEDEFAYEPSSYAVPVQQPILAAGGGRDDDWYSANGGGSPPDGPSGPDDHDDWDFVDGTATEIDRDPLGLPPGGESHDDSPREWALNEGGFHDPQWVSDVADPQARANGYRDHQHYEDHMRGKTDEGPTHAGFASHQEWLDHQHGFEDGWVDEVQLPDGDVIEVDSSDRTDGSSNPPSNPGT